MTSSPRVERAVGSAGAFHARALPDDPELMVWAFDVTTPAIVLGSRQGEGAVDALECARQGVEVVHRRSGGGAVLLLPGEIVWVDVIVPAGHPLWSDDVHESMVRIGECWDAALAGIARDDLAVHRGRLVRTAWSEVVCFAGVGPGEVLAGGRKLVGISQRRTRSAARFQCAVHLRYDVERTISLLARPVPPGRPPADVALLPPGVTTESVLDRFVDALSA